MEVTEADRERVRLRLQRDFVYYPEKAVQILSATGQVIPFKLKRAQKRLAKGLMAQRDSGEPMRAVVLKARKVGFSTQAQVLLVQRATQIPNHLAMTVAQDGDTGAEIFSIGRLAWAHLPQQIKPPIAYERNTDRHKYMQWGESAQLMRRQGIMGLNSAYRVQSAGTAQTASKGRGMTIRSLHLSEVAFWEAPGKKLALVNAVPDDSDTLIVEESTAKGHNEFKDDWDAAVAGESGYLPVFTPWFEEEAYRRPFRTDEQRVQLEADLGTGRYGDDEPELLELIPARIREWEAEWDDPPLTDRELRTRVLEHLHWRRWAIAAKTDTDVEKFHQEYPSTPEEAFLATGRRVFRPEYVAKVLARVDTTDPAVPSKERPGPVRGVLLGQMPKTVRAQRGVTVEVPQRAQWVPRTRMPDGHAPRWRIWEPPKGKGQYIVAVDPESGEENEGAVANSAICVINHKTLAQCAVWEGHGLEPDEVAMQAYLAALHFNRAWIGVEVTGGWGTPHVQRIAREYHYPYVFRRAAEDVRIRDEAKQLGWSTDPKTKPLMEARGNELLREGMDGIRDRRTATQMLTYVRNERGRSGPEPGKLADVLMTWLIAQAIAQERPIKPDRPRGATTYTGNNERVRTRAVA
jgi:hypothetical protein